LIVDLNTNRPILPIPLIPIFKLDIILVF